MYLKYYSYGTDVMLIQSTLKKNDYYNGEVDGLFGLKTLEAVNQFKYDHNLSKDGIFDQAVYDLLEPYIYGFTYYKIKNSDTLYTIAQTHNSTIKNIQTANPKVSKDNLKTDSEIIIPFNYDVVNTNINYSYKVLQIDISALTARYPFLEVYTIGQSVLGRDLIGVRLGIGGKKLFINGAHHSLEWITVVVLMKFIEDYCKAYAKGTLLSYFDINRFFNELSIYIVPMVNPDGIDLVLNGLSYNNPNYNNLLIYNNNSINFSKNWQANNNGVDLNHNYDANFEEAEVASAQIGITSPGPSRYGGQYPFSEPETRAISEFVLMNNFLLTLAYHSQGEIIFYNYLEQDITNLIPIAKLLATASGYKLERIENIGQYAGYKDWFIKETKAPGYTIEVGKGVNPLPISQFDAIYADNLSLLLTAAYATLNI
jgi:g-D-glutamyl-meso-diaminopimelate peptidase